MVKQRDHADSLALSGHGNKQCAMRIHAAQRVECRLGPRRRAREHVRDTHHSTGHQHFAQLPTLAQSPREPPLPGPK